MGNQMNYILKSLSACASVAIMVLTVPVWAQSSAREKTADEILLEQRVMKEVPQGFRTLGVEHRPSFLELLRGLRQFKNIADTTTPHCQDSKRIPFSRKYVLTLDADGRACRIYDLSFPSLKQMLSGQKKMQIPLQVHTASDYLNWLDGNFSGIVQNEEQFKKDFNAQAASKQSWVALLRFVKAPQVVNGLPQSFRLSDLDLGTGYQFDSQTRRQIQDLIGASKSNGDQISSEYFTKLLSRPQTLLEGIRLDWNGIDKAYDVIIEGGFLPLNGPVALVDFQTQYKLAVEKTFRSILSFALFELAGLIPNPTAAAAVQVLTNDILEQVDLAYSYQMLQLEDTLRSGLNGDRSVALDTGVVNQSLNILYGQRADLFSNYMLAVAQGKTFDWQNFERIGKTARYLDEKNREILMAKMNSRLVLEKNCQVEFIHSNFALCSKGGQKVGIYSLISEVKLFTKSFGAPRIYNFQTPYETTLKRGGTWALSIGLRIVGMPISRSVVYLLDSVLKGYMTTGLLDEALLRNSLESSKGHSALLQDSETESLIKWLYIQNLNPFLPKTPAQQSELIDSNQMINFL